MNSFLRSVAHYLPETIVSNEQMGREHPSWNIGEIEKSTGVYSRHYAAPGELASDLALKAAEKLLSETGFDRKNIDFLLFCTQSNDYLTPTTACILQEKLGLGTTTGALDFNLGCTGFVYGLSLAKGLIQSGTATNVLLLTAETITRYIHPEDRSCRILFGDGAAAAIISETDDNTKFIGRFVKGTNGKGASNIMLKYGGSRHPVVPENLADYTDNYGNIHNDRNFFMDGPAVFLFSVQMAPKLIKQTLAENNLTLDDIALIVPHQANLLILDTVRKKAGIPEEKFYVCLEATGNTVSSTIPIALVHALQEGRVKAGDKVLLASFGVGYSWAGTVIGI